MGALINWFPLIVGLTINPKWLKIQFSVIFVIVNLTSLELTRIFRRYSDYPDNFIFWNVIGKINLIIFFYLLKF